MKKFMMNPAFIMKNDLKVGVTSLAFAQNEYLRAELKKHPFAEVRYNTGQYPLSENDLIDFFSGLDGSIIGREKISHSVLIASQKLKVISKFGVGLENIDFSACKRQKVEVRYSAGVNKRSVAEQTLVKIPENLLIDRAALLACAVISGFGAVVHHAKVTPMSSVAVVGCGGVGLNVIQTLKIVGAYPIVAVDVLDSKLEMARAFGATHTVNPKKVSDPIETVYKLTSGRGAEYVFVAVAGISILREAFLMSAYHGMTVILGHGFKEYLSDFQPTDFVGSDRMLTGCAMGGTRFNTRIDIPKIIELYQAGIYKLDELISGYYTLEQINEAIESVEKGEALRNVIMF